MDALPVELVLKILSYLPIPSLSSFQLISRRHRDIVCTNEAYLYHNAALQHRFILSGATTLEDVRASIPRRLQGHINGWGSYCEFCSVSYDGQGVSVPPDRSCAVADREGMARESPF
jgi:hypothetical protein